MRNNEGELKKYIGKEEETDIGYDSLQAKFDDEVNISPWRN